MQRGRFGHRPRNDPRFFGGDYPFIQTGNVVEASKSNGKINYTQTLNELGLLTSRLFQPDALVITIAANIGDTAILDYPACFPDSLVSLIPKTDTLNIYYLNYYFRFIKPYIENLAPQAAQKNINLQQLSPIPVVVPPLQAQLTIVDLLNTAYILKQQKEAQAKALLQGIDTYILETLGITIPQKQNGIEHRMFTANFSDVMGLRFDPIFFNSTQKSHSDIYDNKALKSICKILKGQSITKEKITEGDYPVIAGGQSSPYTHGSYNYEDNVITISASGAYSGYVWYHNYPIFASDCIVLQSKNEADVNTQFIYYVLKALQQEIYKLQQGAGQPHVYARDIEKFTIPIPSIPKQIEMLKHIDDLHHQINTLKADAIAVLENAKAEVEKIIIG
ncbi:EcoKI restriction-modification system protein HsdS [compost metagenome]